MSNRENIIDKILRILGNNWKAVLLIPILVFLWNFKDRLLGTEKLKTLSSDGATISDEVAQNIASALFSAMADIGTDEDLIFSSLRGLSKADFAKVYNAFGLKCYEPTTGQFDPLGVIGFDMDLVAWLTSELSASELERLKRELPFVFSD